MRSYGSRSCPGALCDGSRRHRTTAARSGPTALTGRRLRSGALLGAAGDAGAVRSPSGTPTSRGDTLLLVDDTASKRYVLGSWLRRGGYTVIEAATGTEALRRFREGGIDLVVLDVQPAGHLRVRGLRADQERSGARHDTGDPRFGRGDPVGRPHPRAGAWRRRVPGRADRSQRDARDRGRDPALLPGPPARGAAGHPPRGPRPAERLAGRDDKPASAAARGRDRRDAHLPVAGHYRGHRSGREPARRGERRAGRTRRAARGDDRRRGGSTCRRPRDRRIAGTVAAGGLAGGRHRAGTDDPAAQPIGRPCRSWSRPERRWTARRC